MRIVLIVLLFPLVGYVQTQDCFTLMNTIVADTLQACMDLVPGELCRGSGSITTTPGGGAVVGERLALNTVEQISINGMGAVILQQSPETTLFAFGTLTLNRASSIPNWQAFSIASVGSGCSGSNRAAGVLMQTTGENPVTLNINTIPITFTRTAFLTLQNEALQINILEGTASADGNPTAIPSGFQWTESGSTAPYDYTIISTLPVNLLPRIPRVPLPGQAEVIRDTRLYASANLNSQRLIEDIIPGTILNVYGADVSGQWRHVITPEGESGWIPLEALQYQVSITVPAYEATPQIMSRPYGTAWGRGSTGSGEVNFRTGPGFDEGVLGVLAPGITFSIMGRSTDLEWLYVQLDAPLNGISEGWVNTPVIDLEPPDLRIGELPPVP